MDMSLGMGVELEFWTIATRTQARDTEAVGVFLESCGLDRDAGIDLFVTARDRGRIVACAGVDNNVIKCVAISPDYRGENLTSRLISEAVKHAADLGQFHLFLYTKPENADFFKGCGFYPLVEVPRYVTLMEDTPIGISRYCDRLRSLRRPGAKIGCIVMNANPFTYGHRYLAERASAACDHLFVFVVREDVSMFSYADRFRLVQQGLGDLNNVSVLDGSAYMVSKATFPTYFLKEKGVVGKVQTAVDLLLFRDYIAPALGVSHRFVGTEPFCWVTGKYNEDMQYWLQEAPSPAPTVTVEELPRIQSAHGIAISASEVRALIAAGEFDRIRTLVPKATNTLIEEKYRSLAA